MSDRVWRLAWLWLSLALSGCLSFSTECKVFPGSDAGSCDGGSDAGAPDSGSADAGRVVRLDGGTFVFTQIFPDTTGGHGVYDYVTGISAQDVWIADDLGAIRHYNGGGWAPMFNYHSPQPGVSSELRGLHEKSNGDLFGAALGALITCRHPCVDAGYFDVNDSFSADYVNTGLCAFQDQLCVPGIWLNAGNMSYPEQTCDKGGWAVMPSGTPLAGIEPIGNCAMLSTGDMILGQDHGVGVFVADGGYYQEDAGFGELADPKANWSTFCNMGSSVVALGPGKKVSVRDGAGRWTPVVNAPEGDFSGTWFACASARPDEAILVGSVGPASTIARLSGGVLYLLPDLKDFELRGVWPASDTLWYFVGKDGTGAGVVFTGSRP